MMGGSGRAVLTARMVVSVMFGLGLLPGAAFGAETEAFDVGKELSRAGQGRSVVSVPLLKMAEYTVNAVAVKDEIPTHRHDNGNHVLYIISGQGTATVGGAPVALKSGVVVHIPKGVEHSIKAKGGELRFVDFVNHSAEQKK
jgi:quercetin dioxygenase-like cupin family protein